MGDYRVRVRLEGPIATPLHSGTLFGHLCWSWRHCKGEESLERWLEDVEESPFLISDGMPEGHLPRPLLRPMRPAPGRRDGKRREMVEDREQEKQLRRAKWIAVADFLAIRESLNEAVLVERLRGREKEPGEMLEHRLAHNTIDRLTGTTPKAGGLYFMDEWWPKEEGRDWDVYVKTALAAEQVQELFGRTGEHGYGRDATFGRGRFTAQVEPADPRLFEGRGNRLLSLSHGSLTANMEEARYRLHTHYGKTGSVYSTGESPFKYAMTLLRPGATFRPADGGPFGEFLKGVHKHLPKVGHNAWHLTVAYTERG